MAFYRFLWASSSIPTQINHLPWVCGGDFNEVVSVGEKIGGNDRSIAAILSFRIALADCDISNLGFSGPLITWNNRWGDVANIQERIDRENDCIEIVNSYWDSFGDDIENGFYGDISVQLAGDRNTKYFHSKASNRIRKNAIHKLKYRFGIWKEKKAEIVMVLEDYLSGIFRSSNLSKEILEAATIHIIHIQTKLSTEDASTLLTPFSADEIKRALFSTGPTKVPGHRMDSMRSSSRNTGT
ncbi:Endonuclease/exonuclease/phosphatase [Parasponia andersonii]|uniref:Endonuclease/exonuclease/phosphatase n=1 Tax=Parasponia andersonii TaxID=3476 RepID=A0A2P5BMX5_PARAD|nr:Endonuclease/exonuclease/phosphatase [Parasponia andersonii]